MGGRGAKNPSEIFRAVLRDARAELLLSSNRATFFRHRTIRGDERAAALMSFLSEHLPDSLAVAKGEIIDYLDQRTGQVDIIIYDKNKAAPMSVQRENMLLPCEAVYGVIEVKTILTREEMRMAYKSSAAIKRLRPFKRRFSNAIRDGAPSPDHYYRCQYLLFAYESDLSKDDWLKKEFARAEEASKVSKASLDEIDRIIVLDRGIINPAYRKGKLFEDDKEQVFLEFWVHFINFLTREIPRRRPIDWQIYTSKTSPGWSEIK